MKRKLKMNLKAELNSSVEEFLKRIRNLGQKTRMEYEKTIHSFLSFLASNGTAEDFPAVIKQSTFVAWIKNIASRFSLETVLSHARIIARFLAFLEDTSILKHNSVGILQKQYPLKGLRGVVLALMEPCPQKSLQSLRRPKEFISPLGHSIENYISLAKSQGKRYQNEAEILCRFDRFLMSYSNPPRHLSDSILKKWISLSETCLPSTQLMNFVVVRRFCLYLSRFDSSTYLPDASLVPSKPSALLPYVYSRTEITAFLKAAQQLESSRLSPIRPQTYFFLILLLYTTGMRISEVLNLKLGDIDWKNQTLHIRESKFFKSRLVPVSNSVAKELQSYHHLRQVAGLSYDDEAPLFQNPHSVSQLSKSAVTTTFADICRQLNVRQTDGRRSPCIHSFRHTMAVHRLEDWYQGGENVQTKLGLLSTYLGHAKIASTQRYLTMTSELLQQASEYFRQYAVADQTGEEQ